MQNSSIPSGRSGKGEGGATNKKTKKRMRKDCKTKSYLV